MPLVETIHPKSACTPSMRGGQTPGPMATGSSISKVDMRLKDQRFLKPPGRRSMKNGLRGPSEDCPSGSVNDQERKLVIPRAPKMARKELKEPHQRMKNNSRTSQLLIHIKVEGFVNFSVTIINDHF